jgi:alanyl-tRNA synthetase
MTKAVLTDLVDAVIKAYGESYPNLVERQDYIKRIIRVEEDRFQATIDQGLSILTEYMDQLKASGSTQLSGENAFRLYDTYGFPLELTMEILEEYNMTVDESSFKEHMSAQRERARTARGTGEDLGWANDAVGQLPVEIQSKFNGYDYLELDSKLIAIVGEEVLEEAFEGMEISLILEETPFYPEGGGQVGDVGMIFNDRFKAEIVETQKGVGNRVVHHAKIVSGHVHVGDTVTAAVDVQKRMATARNHSVTHLLHKALRNIVGTHVEQAGSYVDPYRLRFDFSHFEAISKDMLKSIEAEVNRQIYRSMPVEVSEMDIESARKKGAMALFGEKYGDLVRVVSMGDFSVELCGGTHLKNTSEAGMFKIISESGVAAGVRRIEATTGENVYKLLTQMEEKLQSVSDILKTSVHDLEVKAETTQMEIKTLLKENEQLKNKLAKGALNDVIEAVQKIGVFDVVTAKFEGVDMNTLRNMGDQLKNTWENSVVVLANNNGDKLEFLAMVSDQAIKNGAHAGNIIREVAKTAGGGGGGKPNMAQAGGKDLSKIDEALQKVYVLLS